MPERRSTLRAVARIEVYDRDANADRVPLYVAGNVSSGGMFLITQSPFDRGTNLKINFSLPGQEQPVQAVGSVVWSRNERSAPDRQPGMGVQFIEIKKEDVERIRAFVNNQTEFD
jgi:uncharacterized protein (TIGR02266 family)